MDVLWNQGLVGYSFFYYYAPAFSTYLMASKKRTLGLLRAKQSKYVDTDSESIVLLPVDTKATINVDVYAERDLSLGF